MEIITKMQNVVGSFKNFLFIEPEKLSEVGPRRVKVGPMKWAKLN
jgi:hypothetical protein